MALISVFFQFMKRIYLILLLALSISNSIKATPYYQQRDYGSDSLYAPLGNFLSYSLDTLQVPDSFSTDNFEQHFDEVMDNLSNPRRAINNEGGFNRFVNRQIFPVDSEHSNESWAILPNYGLHLLGGGIAFRKDLEYFRANNVDNATLYSATLAMTAELLQEVLEKQTTMDDDAVADFYIFRPLGILLFSNDATAKFVMETLDPAIWPYLQAFDFSEDRFINTGINYIYRPPATEFSNTRLFVFTGLNNQIGLSHRLGKTDWFSWGVGLATQRIDFSLDRQAELDTSLGFFYDRNKSLLWSLVFNDTGGQDFRFNLFPTNSGGLGNYGYYIGSNSNDSLTIGFTWSFQMGIGLSK